MRFKTVLLGLAIFVLAFTFPAALSAQEELTQTFTSADGLFTMSYPEGWTAREEDGLITFSSDQAFMQVNYRDYGEEVTAREVFNIGGSTNYGFSEAEERVIAGYSAIQAQSSDQLRTVINLCEGTLALAIGYVNPGDVPTYAPTFIAMLETLRFREGEPQSCREAFAGLQRITVANAAQVSQLTTFGDETVPISSVAFNPDGSAFAAGAVDGSVRIWSTVTGDELLTLTGHRDGATSVAFGSGGYNLAVGTGSGEVRLWDAISGDGYGTTHEHSTAVESVAFTDFLIASGSLDGEVRLYDMIMGDERAALVDSGNPTPVASVAFSLDQTLLAAGGGNMIRLWNVESGTIQAALETEISDIASVAFSPDGTVLVYGGSDPAVWVWNLSDDHHVLFEGNSDQVFALAFSPGGQVIAAGDSATLRLWDAATGAMLAALPTASGEPVNSIAFSPAGTLIASAGDAGGVVLWGTSSHGEQETITSGASSGAAESTTTGESQTSASACTITAPSSANQRSGPGTNFDRAGTLAAGTSADVAGQATGPDGFVWWRLGDGVWVRSDVVNENGDCEDVPIVQP